MADRRRVKKQTDERVNRSKRLDEEEEGQSFA